MTMLWETHLDVAQTLWDVVKLQGRHLTPTSAALQPVAQAAAALLTVWRAYCSGDSLCDDAVPRAGAAGRGIGLAAA